MSGRLDWPPKKGGSYVRACAAPWTCAAVRLNGEHRPKAGRAEKRDRTDQCSSQKDARDEALPAHGFRDDPLSCHAHEQNLPLHVSSSVILAPASALVTAWPVVKIGRGKPPQIETEGFKPKVDRMCSRMFPVTPEAVQSLVDSDRESPEALLGQRRHAIAGTLLLAPGVASHFAAYFV